MSEQAWVSINLQAQAVVQGSTASCQVVSLHSSGAVVLPAMKGQAGMALELEVHPSNWREPVRLPAQLVREGEYHGHYAWQIQFTELSQQATMALLELMGLEAPTDGTQYGTDHSEVIPAEDEEVRIERHERGLRSYSDLFVDIPEIEGVKEVDEAEVEDDGSLQIRRQQHKDLLDAVDQDNVKRIYKEALKQLKDSDERGKKKKKGWFSR